MNSQEIYQIFESRKIWRRFISILFIFLYAFYLSWRITIINEDSLILSISYFIAEFFGFILGLNTIFKSWDYNYRKPKKAKSGLKIDVLIPTYKEPIHIIRKTLLSAKNIEYPHETIVLDDGKRNDVKELAQEIGIKYYSRSENIDAKAGNLNFGLSKSNADYFLVLDADHIVLPNAIDSMLGYFEDEKIAMVQAPQTFYNSDSFQYINSKKTKSLWHDQSFYYNICQPCLDKNNIVSSIGSGVIYKRNAIDEIGGIPTASLCEDTYTSYLLGKFGYKTIYYNDVIAYGVAASDLTEYYKTRKRWAFGNIQVAKNENVVFTKNLNWRLRYFHMALFLDHFEGWQQVLLLNIPILSLIFGLSPFDISVFNILITFIFPFIIFVLLQEIGCGFSRTWTNEIFSMLRWPIYLSVIGAWFNKKLQWASSSKNVKSNIEWRFIYPQISILVLGIFSLIFAFFRLKEVGFKTGAVFLYFENKFRSLFEVGFLQDSDVTIRTIMKVGYTCDLVLVSGIWVIYNIIRITFLIRKIIIDDKNSNEFYRFKTFSPIKIHGNSSYLLAQKLSEDYIEFFLNEQNYDELKKVELFFPTKSIAVNLVNIKREGYLIKANILYDSTQDRDDLCNAIYYQDIEREFVNKNANFMILSNMFLSLFKRKRQNHEIRITSLIYDKNKIATLNNFPDNENNYEIILYEDLNIGDEILATQILATEVLKAQISKNNNSQIKLKISKKFPNFKRGFDGSYVKKYKAQIQINP